MEKGQVIISIGREYGSGGHYIATKLAEKFSLPLYDSNLMSDLASEKNLHLHKLKKYDEVPKKRLFSRTVNGYSNSPEENVANLQIDYLRTKAAEGNSFVVVGRCSEEILAEYDGLIKIFILADMQHKIDLVKNIERISAKNAENLIHQMDKKRKTYHNYYCKGKWGDSRNYDLCLNSTTLGLDDSVEFIADYVRRRMNK